MGSRRGGVDQRKYCSKRSMTNPPVGSLSWFHGNIQQLLVGIQTFTAAKTEFDFLSYSFALSQTTNSNWAAYGSFFVHNSVMILISISKSTNVPPCCDSAFFCWRHLAHWIPGFSLWMQFSLVSQAPFCYGAACNGITVSITKPLFTEHLTLLMLIGLEVRSFSWKLVQIGSCGF